MAMHRDYITVKRFLREHTILMWTFDKKSMGFSYSLVSKTKCLKLYVYLLTSIGQKRADFHFGITKVPLAFIKSHMINAFTD
jgi:hypothetical protein